MKTKTILLTLSVMLTLTTLIFQSCTTDNCAKENTASITPIEGVFQYLSPLQGQAIMNHELHIGNWLPKDKQHIETWIKDLKQRVKDEPKHLDLVAPIQEFKDLVDNEPNLKLLADKMFKDSAKLKKLDPLGSPELDNFDDFLVLLNAIMTQAPEYTEYQDPKTGALEPCGLIG
ncbi:MAG TPA: phophatidylserine decarboxylase associated domain-containing protein, partial [Bacteroidales bacterium]|nr:phophatidylserine decarboxylase associated domain-containing protein [Bacteroidales bacterium]